MHDFQDIFPEKGILARIFRGAKSVSVRITEQSWTRCCFVAQPDNTGENVYVILRANEPKAKETHAVAALQELAALAIPDLVPKVIEVGTATAINGDTVYYTVAEYVPHAISLEEVWENLEVDQQARIMEQIVGAVRKLHGINLRSDAAQEILKKIEPEQTGLFTRNENEPALPLGGPEMGFTTNAVELIRILIGKFHDFNKFAIWTKWEGTMEGQVVTITVKSPYTEVNEETISMQAINSLSESVVLCHDDLEPRNILVLPPSNDNPGHYKVVSLVNWEMAGLFPFAWEWFHKDLALGLNNLSYSYYRLFKDQTATLLPNPLPETYHELFRALDMPIKARGLKESRNVGRNIQRKWFERERLVRAGLATGWVRDLQAGDVGKFSKKDNEDLELQVCKELGFTPRDYFDESEGVAFVQNLRRFPID